MSAAEQLVPAALPSVPNVGEVEKARREDPEFAEVLARARALARNEPYNQELHGPFDVRIKPRRERLQEVIASDGQPEKLAALLHRFAARKPKQLGLEALLEEERREAMHGYRKDLDG